MKKIIDISEHNGYVELDKAKPWIDGVIARCSWGWGENQIDRQWISNASQATALKIPLYAYHFAYARSIEEARKEANLALCACQNFPVNVIYYDMEYSEFQGELTPDEYYEIAQAFCDVIESNHIAVGIYANEYYFRTKLTNPGFAQWTLWLANYGNNDGYDAWNGTLQYNPFGHVLLHQFTSNARQGILKDIEGINSTLLDCSADHGLLSTFPMSETTELPITIGSQVKVKDGAIWYDGEGIAKFVFDKVYEVMEVVGERVVIGADNHVTGAIHIKNIECIS